MIKMECPFIDEKCGECLGYDIGTENGVKKVSYIRKDIREQIRYGMQIRELEQEQGQAVLNECDKCYGSRLGLSYNH